MHFDKTHLYDKKDLRLQKFATDDRSKKDDELFADLMDILDTSEPFLEFGTILYKSSKNYPYFDESQSRSSTPFPDIPNQMKDELKYEEDDVNSENEKSRLQLNKGDKDPGIPSLANAIPKKS